MTTTEKCHKDLHTAADVMADIAVRLTPEQVAHIQAYLDKLEEIGVKG